MDNTCNQYFKDKHTYEERESEASRVRRKYPHRYPVIVEKTIGCDNVPSIDKIKFLVPGDLTIGQLIYVIRKRIKMGSEMGLFIFINDTMPTTADTVSVVYDTHKDEDGFLYVKYSGENTFG